MLENNQKDNSTLQLSLLTDGVKLLLVVLVDGRRLMATVRSLITTGRCTGSTLVAKFNRLRGGNHLANGGLLEAIRKAIRHQGDALLQTAGNLGRLGLVKTTKDL